MRTTAQGSLCKPSAIFASNTSSLAITAQAEASGRPSQFVGLHFFNPVQLMRLVEVIATEHTSPETLEAVKGWATRLPDKVVVSCKDTPGQRGRRRRRYLTLPRQHRRCALTPLAPCAMVLTVFTYIDAHPTHCAARPFTQASS
jgi:hypothetical protein